MAILSGYMSNRTIFTDDFKPASVDDSKEARVDVGSDNTVTVTVPHLDGAGTPHTVFKGSQRPYNKEYVLILDKITGEITLEKLTANVQVKKTRAEPKRNSNSNTSMPVEVKRSPTYGRANGRTKVISGKKKEPLLQLHPKQSSPRRSPYDKTISPNIFTNGSSPVQSSSGQPTLASLPMIGSDNDDFGLSTSLMPGSSSSQDLASQSIPMSNTKSTTLESDSSSSSSSSDSSSSDYETENVSVPTINSNLNNTNVSSTLFMSDNLLNDDLQLSESESD
ncbi:ell-associated factor Eaf isoform X3 [Monomorium pharaonis]|uniref:ell-associated factor Eaf isoform X3 n=1 Tax=Monomorium pharaonis TaxID=307658 RepID=UPI00063F46A6|nr:ell-associated factor Eaf isoform X3 [Monomorium pharaonis]